VKKIKAVLFDLDGTLFHYHPTSGEIMLNHLRDSGFHISEEDRIRAEHWVHYYFAHSTEIQDDDKTFGNDKKGYWINFTRRRLLSFGLPTSQANELAPQVSDYMSESYRPKVHVPEDAHVLLELLHEAGYVLGMVSNRESPFREDMQEQRLDCYFRFFLAGGEINSFKPDLPIFERALELAGTSPQETLYIGDNYFADIVGSRRAGLTPVLYDPIRLFPEADCAVIKCFAELPELLD
jgi:FMN phosphatase YigB (HAD superfamily)